MKATRTQGSCDPETAVFRFFPVDAALGRFVSYLYTSFVPSPFTACVTGYRVPELAPQLVFAVEEGSEFPGGLPLGDGRRATLFLQPAHLTTISIPATIREAVGASLRPHGLRVLMPFGAGDFGTTSRIALEELWGARGRELMERLAAEPNAQQRVALLRSVLTERAFGLAAPNTTASHALRLVERTHGEMLIGDIADSCGVTSRALHSVVTREVGLTPKQIARIVRLRRALELIQAATGSLSAISMASAYSDQAHLSREFRRLVGITPSELARQVRALDARPPAYSTEGELLSTGLLLVPRAGEATGSS